MLISSLARETNAGHLTNDDTFTENGDSNTPNIKAEINIE